MEKNNSAPLLVEKESILAKSTAQELRNRNSNSDTSQVPPLLKQSFVVTGGLLQKIGCGTCLGHTAILMPFLMASDSAIPISDEEASWIITMSTVGGFVAIFISPFVMKHYGRRYSIISSSLFTLLGWATLGTAQSITPILIGRFFHGFSNVFQMVALSTFITEITDSQYRGFFLGTLVLSLALGKWIVHLLGTFYDWRKTGFICSSFSLASIIILFLSPESPNYYAGKNQFDAAQKSFIWLRGSSNNSLEEMKIFINYKMESNLMSKNTEIKSFYTRVIDFLTKREIYKSFFTVYVIMIVYVSSLNEMLATYTVNILKSVLGSEKYSYIIMNTMDVVRIIAALVAIVLIRKFSRRSVYFTSGAMTVISMMLFSLVGYLIAGSFISYSTLLVGIIMNLMIFSMAVGTLPLTFVYAGELFPLAYKEFGGFAMTLTSVICFFVMYKTSIFFFKYLNTFGIFLVYSVVHLAALIVLYYILPETKGNTLVELENKLLA